MPSRFEEACMLAALEEAKTAAAQGEVPIGCVITLNGKILARAHNLRESTRDVTSHAEILALREAAAQQNSWRLDGAVVFVTLEPCPMCASALQQARVAKVFFAAADPKAGAVVSTDHFFDRVDLNHKVLYQSGPCEAEAAEMLRDFFRQRRARNKALNQALGGRAARRKLMELRGSSLKSQEGSAEAESSGQTNRPDVDAGQPLS